jgi:actin-related protein
MSMNVITTSNPALVYDCGTSSIKFGYGGDSRPLFNLPPAFAQRLQDGEDQVQFGEEWLHRRLPGIEVRTMIDADGAIIDREIIKSFLDWTYQTCFNDIDPADWSILFSQPSALLLHRDKFNTRREIIAETAIEFSGHPNLSFQHDSALACYAHQMHTGLVVDFGSSCVRVVPVLEGHPLRRSVRVHPLGGFELTNILRASLTENGKLIRTFLDAKPTDGFGGLFTPPTRIVTPTTTQLDFCRRNVLTDMLKCHLRFDNNPDETILDYVYYMAGREPMDIEMEIRQLSHCLFESAGDRPAVQNLIAESIAASPIEFRDTFWNNIILSGGFSKLRGLDTALQAALKPLAPTRVEARIVPPVAKDVSGAQAVWVGGSIVASFPDFLQLCISGMDWRDHGAAILDRKCL